MSTLLQQKFSSILPNTPFKLKLEKAPCIFKNGKSRPSKEYKWVGEVKPKVKALWHFKVEAIKKFEDQVLELSRSQWILLDQI